VFPADQATGEKGEIIVSMPRKQDFRDQQSDAVVIAATK